MGRVREGREVSKVQNPKEKVISASQGHFLSDLVKKAAGLVLKEDSSGSSDTEAVRILMDVCDVLDQVNPSSSGSSTDKNSSAAAGSSQ